MRVGVVVASDKAFSGERPDRCVAALEEALAGRGSVAARLVVPDEIPAIRRAVCSLADGGGADLVVVAGGTGVGPRDVTPEALLPLLEKVIPGVGEAVRAAGMRSKPSAILTRSVAGTRGDVIVIALPGSPGGAAEGLAAVWPALAHGLATLLGEARECAEEGGKPPRVVGRRA